jgi:Zn-dependent M28 family amino/carboxypeptidase
VSHRTRRSGVLAALAASALLASGLAAAPALADGDRADRHRHSSPDRGDDRDDDDRGHHGHHGKDPAAKLAKKVTLKDLLRHAKVLQHIGDRNDGNRASGLPGYDASADYVAHTMRKAGYDVTVQEFEFPYFEELGPSSFAQVGPTPTTYVDGEDYDLMDYSGSGTVEAPVVPIDLNLTPPRASTSGCEPTDFLDAAGNSIVTDKIALMQRGTCPFGDKVANAATAGAVGAVVMNQGNGDPVQNADRYELLLGTLGGPVDIPAVSTGYFLGEELANTANLVLSISADTISTIRSTSNVLAQSRWGRTDNVVMAGAHLDSEPDTVGINDNGSGSIALLEVAKEMRKFRTENAVRFAWWGAEEAGLQGSNHYVDQLTEQEIADIALYLNFDMIASPNYTLGVYDGDDSAQEGSGPGPDGSAAIEAVFQEFFAERGEQTRAADFTGRSDYGPFIAAGVDIPAGGLFTGAETIKTEADVAVWGGLAGEQMDVCYHDPCDSLRPEEDGAPEGLHDALEDTGYDLYGNLNKYAFDLNADAVATAVMTFARDTSAVNGEMPQGDSDKGWDGSGKRSGAHRDHDGYRRR